MIRTTFLLVVALVFASAGFAQEALVLRNVNVIDVREGRVVKNQSVVIEGGRITSVAGDKETTKPKGARVIDAKDRYLIPGLWDMHVHAAWPGLDQIVAPLFVANGVTGVRDMYGAPYVISAWKQRYRAGEACPRMIASGHILDGPKPFWPGSVVVTDEEEARNSVATLQKSGADFIKVYTKLPREVYFAALDEAKKLGIPVDGHVPDAVSVAEASDHGQRCVEHLTGVALECSHEADLLRTERADAATDSTAKLLKTYMKQSERVLATQDDARAAELFAKLARNKTWQCPTFTVLRSMSMMNDPKFAADPRVKYMPADVVGRWDWKKDFRFRARTEEDWANGRKLFQLSLENVGKMHHAGVPIIAGTDMLNPFTFPGFSLHDELGLLVEAGLSPAEALRAATLNPAVFMNATDSLGTVEPGKCADLVLLDDNPLDDIHHTQKVNSVVLNGRLYDRKALDALLADAQKRARPEDVRKKD